MAYIGPEPIIVQDGGTGVQTLAAHGVVIGQGTSSVNVTTPGTIGQVLRSNGPSADPSFQNNTDLHTAKFIVGDTTNGANFSTINAAIASAQGTGVNSTIFIQPGTYTENITLVAGINLSAFGCDGLTTKLTSQTGRSNVTIVGTVTASYTGTCVISGIQLKTNGAAAIVTSGSASSALFISNCTLYANDATGMTINNSNMSIIFMSCYFISTSTNLLFSHTTGSTSFNSCIFALSATASASTISGTNVGFDNCVISGLSLTVSGTLRITSSYITFGGITLITTSGASGTCTITDSRLESTTATTIVVAAGGVVNLMNSSISSTNTAAISGAGTLNYGGVVFASTSRSITATTQNPLPQNSVGIGPSTLLSTEIITLTNAQVKAMFVTPVQIISAPAAGQIIVPVMFLIKLIYGGNNAFTGGGNIQLVDSGGELVVNAIAATAITGTANNYAFKNASSSATTLQTNYQASAISINNATGAFTGNAANDNTVQVQVFYYIISM